MARNFPTSYAATGNQTHVSSVASLFLSELNPGRFTKLAAVAPVFISYLHSVLWRPLGSSLASQGLKFSFIRVVSAFQVTGSGRGVTGSFKDTPITEWLIKHNPSQVSNSQSSIWLGFHLSLQLIQSKLVFSFYQPLTDPRNPKTFNLFVRKLMMIPLLNIFQPRFIPEVAYQFEMSGSGPICTVKFGWQAQIKTGRWINARGMNGRIWLIVLWRCYYMLEVLPILWTCCVVHCIWTCSTCACISCVHCTFFM